MKAILISIILTFLSTTSLVFADDELKAKREACKEIPSKTWSSTLNRCVLKSEYKDNLKNYRSCTNLETKQLRDDCFFKLSKEVSGDTDFDDYSSTSEAVINSLSFLMSGINMAYMGKSKEYTSCTSLKMSTGCGAVAVLKEFYIKSEGKKATKSIKEDFLEKVKEQEDYETQVLAYQSQIDQLKSISKFYGLKKKGHMVAGLCYLATVAIAASEGLTGMTCTNATHDSEGNALDQDTIDKNKGGLDKFEKDLNAMGKAESMTSPHIGTWMKYTATPWGIAALNTVNFGYQMYLSNFSDEQAEKADLLAKRMDVAKNQFVDGMGHYCPQGHEDKSDLMCYCYENGKKKSNRTNSQACQNLWSSRDRQLYVASENKKRGAIAKERSGCVTVNGQFDPNCECRKFKDQEGNNACKKTNFSTVDLGSFGTQINVKELESEMNKITQGIPTPGDLSISDDKLNALGKQMKKQLVTQLKTTDKNGKQRQMTLKDFEKIEGGLMKQANALANKGGPKSDIGSPLASAKSDVEEINKVLPQTSKGLVMSGGSGINKAKKKKKNDFNLSFNTQNSRNSVQNFSESYMDKSYDTKDADINKRKDVSIFKILSNRYNKSGYKRLFND